MDATLTQYRKMAYLSYQLIIHFKELQYTDTETILSMDVKHIHDSHYQLVVFTSHKHLDFITAFRPAFYTSLKIFNTIKHILNHPQILTKERIVLLLMREFK